ncbi:MAG: glycoside hydrolase family 3 protein [Gemmatimonadota bacterium]|nr:glycoside hydrolase family 3 protein [Gemmatimonadota bacterium]
MGFALAACAARPEPPAPLPAPVLIPDPYAVLPEVTVERLPPKVTVDSVLRTLSSREKIGQLVFPWLLGDYSAFDGPALASVLAAVDSFGVGGIIISIGSPLDVASKLNALQRRSRLPLLITADLEYGSGMRLVGGTAFPAVMAIGATGRELDAYELGRVTALEARAVGIHLTFSPVADVNNNPTNPIINTRSWGEDPAAVGRLIAAYVRGAEEHGLFTTAKHFPGHGDTGIDSHISVPVATGCWDRLDSLELEPFRAAIRAEVTAVMTAHIALPCLDGADPVPATFNSRVMTEILRDSLGFTGLVVTDALVMGAIVERFGPGESAVRAFLAGADLLIMPADIGAAVAAMQAALESGRISPARLDASVRRVLTLKQRANLFTRRLVPLDEVPQTVGQQAFQAIADDIAQRALTLVARGPLDDFRSSRGRTAVISYAEETNLSIGNELLRELRAHGETVTEFRLYPASGSASYDSARTAIARAGRVVFASSVRPIAWRGHIALPDSLAALIGATAATRPTMLVSFGSPYLLGQLPRFAGGYLIAWSNNLATERATARALTGRAPITGRLPITLEAGHPIGSGIVVGGQTENRKGAR